MLADADAVIPVIGTRSRGMYTVDGRKAGDATGTANEVRVSSVGSPGSYPDPEGGGVLQNAGMAPDQKTGPHPRPLPLPASNLKEMFRFRNRGPPHRAAGNRSSAKA